MNVVVSVISLYKIVQVSKTVYGRCVTVLYLRLQSRTPIVAVLRGDNLESYTAPNPSPMPKYPLAKY